MRQGNKTVEKEVDNCTELSTSPTTKSVTLPPCAHVGSTTHTLRKSHNLGTRVSQLCSCRGAAVSCCMACIIVCCCVLSHFRNLHGVEWAVLRGTCLQSFEKCKTNPFSPLSNGINFDLLDETFILKLLCIKL